MGYRGYLSSVRNKCKQAPWIRKQSHSVQVLGSRSAAQARTQMMGLPSETCASDEWTSLPYQAESKVLKSY